MRALVVVDVQNDFCEGGSLAVAGGGAVAARISDRLRNADSRDADSRGADSPDTGAPGTGAPDTGAPDTDSPDTGAPDTGAPDTGAPDTGAPDTGAPDTGAPDTGAPGTGAPGTGAPGTGSVGTGSVGTGSVGTGSVGTGSVGTGSVGTGSVGTGSGWDHVVATRDHHIDPGAHFSDTPDFVDSWPPHCRWESPGASFHPALDVARIEAVFDKGEREAAYSGFQGAEPGGSGLADWLRARGVTEVDVVGLATDHCVKATALDAVAAGFATTVLLELCAGVAPETTERALTELRAAGVAIH